MHALLDKKFKHTLAHSNVQNFKGTFYLSDYGMHVRVNLYRFSLSTTISFMFSHFYHFQIIFIF